MKKQILLLIIIIPFVNFSQNIDKEIREMIKSQSFTKEVEEVIEHTIEYNNFDVEGGSIILFSSENSGGDLHLDNEWTRLKERIKAKGVKSFLDKLVPIYKETFTEKELKKLIKFSKSKTGKSIEKKQVILQKKIRKMALEWSNELMELIQSELNERNRTAIIEADIEKFDKQFTEKHNVLILNYKDLKIDNKNNPGTLLVDFENGKTTEKFIELKNIGNEDLELKTFGFTDDEFSIEFENNPIKPNETGKIIFKLDKSKTKSSDKYLYINIFSNTDFQIPVALQYKNIENKHYNPVSFSLNTKQLNFVDFDTEFSKPYTFELKNTGDVDISVSAWVNNDFTYINYPQGKIRPGETAVISVVYSKSLIEKYKPEKINTELKVYVRKYIDMSMFDTFDENDKNNLKLIIK